MMLYIVLLLSIASVQSFNTPVTPKSSIQISQHNFKDMIKSVIIGTSLVGFNGIAIADETKPKTKRPKVLETENGVKFIEVKKGEGSYPIDGDYVVISYTGFLPDGKAFDTTEAKGKKPLAFRMGKKEIIPGITFFFCHVFH
jgi:hypothetical protein